jgi:hypothetical protein
MDTAAAPFWVLIEKLSTETGYTVNAIRAKQKKNQWKFNVHWKRAPDKRLVFNLPAIQKWMASGVH